MENNNKKITEDILNTGAILIKAISAQINSADFQFPSDTDFNKLAKLAYNHRVSAVVAESVIKSSLADEKIKNDFKKELFRTSARYSALERETLEISEEFTKNAIKHCFLKGVKVCAFHNQPDTRFMLDMDLYVEPEKFNQAEAIMLERGYECNTFGDDKDTGYTKKPFFNVELHRELKYEYDKGYDYYKGAFERMVSADGYSMNMTNEDFYVYILSHSAHHFETAGTGIKSVIDHFYLREKLKPLCDEKLLADGLEKTGLTLFENRMNELCDYWFGGAAADEATMQMAEYILLSGVFGNETNHYLSGILRGEYSQKKSSYFFARLFPPLKTMSFKYNVLKKIPVLLPLFWVVRLITAIFSADRIADEAKGVSTVNEDDHLKQKSFLEKMGL